MIGVGKQGAGAGDVFLGMDGVDGVLRFVALVGNGEHADAMDRGVGSAESGNTEPQVIPREVDRVDDKTESDESSSDAGEEPNGGRRCIGRRHKAWLRGYCALRGLREQR